MSKCKTRLTIVAVLAVVASTFVSASPTLAQTDGQRPSAPVAGRAPEPEVFVPAAPTLHSDDAALLAEAAAPGAPLALRRPIGGQFRPSETTTAVSRHSVDAEGKGTAELYAQPAFRRSAGRWVEVDSTLRRTPRADQPVAAEGALRPVRFGTSADRILELGLDQGPVTLSSPSLNLGQPSLEAATVTYNDVAPDTDLRYVVSDDGVKEELVLHSASAPRSFTFHLADPSAQLGTPTRDEAGGWTFPNPVEEGVQLTLPPALAWEAGVEGEPVASDPTSANLEVVAAGDGWDLTVSVDEAWLAGKSFPVVLDPTLTYSANSGTGPTLEGYAVRNTSSCAASCTLTRNSYLFAGSWGTANPVRSYLRYDMSSIPTDARIDSASFNAYINSCMNTSTPDPCANKTWLVDLTRMAGDWDASSTFAELEAATSGARGPHTEITRAEIPSWMQVPFLESMVQRWVNGSSPNYGFAMRSLNESNDQAGLAFASSRWSTTSRRPSLSVSYTVVAPGTPEVAAYPGNGAARVHWGIPNSGGAPIDHYLIKTYRSGSYVGSKTVTCPCPTVATVDGLANGSSYSFTVQAHNSEGYSAAATSPSVIPSAALPTSPSPAAALPGNAAARLDWSHPSTGAAAVDHYVVQAYDTDTGYLGAVTVTCPCPTTAPVGVLANGERYILAVYAHNQAGYGAPAISGSVVPASNRPGPPASVVAQAAPRAVDITWQAPSTSGGSSISSYTVRPYDALTGYLGDAKARTITCPCGTTAARIEGLAPGRTYVFAVIATTANGSGVPGLSGAVELANVPGAPTSLAAVPGDGRAALSWDASSPNGSPVTGYTLTASPGGATTPAPGDATSAMFEGLANGTAYTFTAVATNAVGDSATSLPSNEVTPSADSSLLSPLVDPTNVVATRGDTTATVTWDHPSVTLVTTFEVTTYRASDRVELGTTNAGTDDSVTVTGLKNGTPVYFTVTAKSLLLSGTSEPSNTVTPAGPPFAPTDVVATRGDRQVEVSWNPPGPREDGTPGDNGDPISSYTVTVFRADDNVEVATAPAATSPVTVGDLTNGTAYYAKVKATNGVGVGQESAPSNTVTPAGRPFAPTGVTAFLDGSRAIVRWLPADGNGAPVTSYTVTASRGGLTATVDGAATSASVAGLQEGTSYTFRVVATNDVGDSEPSAPSNAVTRAERVKAMTSPVAAGRQHSLVVMTDRTVFAWGTNTSGQLGDGTTTNNIDGARVAELTDVMAVAAGEDHSLAVLDDGSVWGWGDNGDGEIGSFAATPHEPMAVQVPKIREASALAAGADHSLALAAGGSVWAWGDNDNGQLGTGTAADSSTPALVGGLPAISAIAAGDDFSLALAADGSVWAWGDNSSGQLGDATGVDASTPRLLSGMSNMTRLAAGSLHALAERADGTVWAWGDNTHGQLGNGTSGPARSTPVQVSGLSYPTALAAGQDHSVAVASDGATWGWGSNAEYQLGNNSNVSSATPVRVLQSNPDQPLGDVVAVAARGAYSATILVGGKVREFGLHFDGVVCIVADPKITIAPGFEPTFFIPDLEKTRPRMNQIVYRVYDVAAQTQDGRFWTPVDPEIFGPDNFRVIAGLPDRQTEGDGLATGLLGVISAVVVVGPAAEVRPSQEAAPGPSYRRYPGGLLEYQIVDAEQTVTATRFKPLDRSYGGVPAGCEPAPRGCVGETIE